MPVIPYDVRLRTLRKAVVHRPPYTSGTVSVRENELIVYYGKEGDVPGRINFNNTSEDALARLAKACDSATFGRNKEDVLDESYRKAGKLDRGSFSVDLDLEQNGLMEIIRSELLETTEPEKAIRAELYKLNVYGEGSFFKYHKDTPRGESMFGSLVVFYPTAHEGGALLFRDGDSEWTFDSAQAVAAHDGPCVAYAAFFSDVDHEVAVVRSGYRATVTYNLYFVDSMPSAAVNPPSSLAFNSALQTLLEDPSFMPDGGILGFGLRRVYPVMQEPKFKVPLDYLKPFLKGSDADILRACDAFHLTSKIWMVYQEYATVAIPSAINMQEMDFDESVAYFLLKRHGAKRINALETKRQRIMRHFDEQRQQSPDKNINTPFNSTQDSEEEDPLTTDDCDDEYGPIAIRVQWVTPPQSSVNVFDSSYVTYGNEPGIGHAYGYMSLFVEVGKPGSRATRKD